MKHTILSIFITLILFKSLVKLAEKFDRNRLNKIFEKITICKFKNKNQAEIEIMNDHEHSYSCSCHTHFVNKYFSLTRAVIYICLFAFLFKLVSAALG